MRYYFDVQLGSQLHRDNTGKDFSSPDEARLYAIECGRQCYLGDNPLDKEVLRNLSIKVTDRQGSSNVVAYSDIAKPLPTPLARA
jgi:hypothetical protein